MLKPKVIKNLSNRDELRDRFSRISELKKLKKELDDAYPFSPANKAKGISAGVRLINERIQQLNGEIDELRRQKVS